MSEKVQKNKRKIFLIVFDVLAIELKDRIKIKDILDLIQGYSCTYAPYSGDARDTV